MHVHRSSGVSGLAILQVNNAPQFLQLKKMMATKNEEIKSLRVRLNK
jgi:hypothetical protein